jgi:hypothetical protein
MTSGYEELQKMVGEVPLGQLLRRVLKVAQQVQNVEFEKWVRLELNGYWNTNAALTEDTIVPSYRTIAGYWTDDFGRRFMPSEPELAFVNELRLRFRVIELEGMVGAKGPLALRPTEFTDVIQEHLGVAVTTFNFNPSVIPSVLTCIETELSKQLFSIKPGGTNVGMRSDVNSGHQTFHAATSPA